MTSNEDIFSNEQKLYTRVSMLPLYDRLLKIPFRDTVSAIEHCRNVCADFGFTVKQEASANRNIYVYCSREGLPDSQRNPKPTPQRKRPSKRCDCRWRVVLSENDQEQWEFRKSMNPNASEHNHEMMAPSEMIKAWPPEVNEMIIYLAQQRLQTHEIRDAVKQRFPLISWNERRFYNRLTEERKRIRQRNTTERTRRLILLASQLCAVVASNEEWSQCVEGDLQRMFENFCHLTRLTPEAVSSLVDLQPDDPDRSPSSSTDTHRLSIGTLPDDGDTDDSVNQGPLGSSLFKKRKAPGSNNTTRHQQTQSPPPPAAAAAAAAAMATSQKRGVQCVSIPAFNVYVRSQSLRASSESSQGSRRTWESASGLGSPGSSSFIGNSGNNNGIFSLSSPTSSSSSSSSSIPFRQQPFRLDVQQRLTSPPLNASPHDANSFVMPQQQQQQQQQQSYALTNLTYNMQTSFSPYSISTPSFSSPNDMTYTLDNAQTTTPATTTAQQSQLPHQLAVSTSRPDHHHHQQQHHQQERPMFGDFCPSIKEERNNAMYDRALSVTGYTTTPLPMIRPNDHSAVPVTSAEPTASYY